MAILLDAYLKAQMISCGKSRTMKSKGTKSSMNLSLRKRKDVSRKPVLVSNFLKYHLSGTEKVKCHLPVVWDRFKSSHM